MVTADGVDDSVRIDGFTITEGLAEAGSDFTGAGMEILNASLTVVRITFTANAAPIHGGGAMHIGGVSDPMVINTSFIGNSGNEAGALHTESGGAGGTFVNCLFSVNTSDVEGGAINPGGSGVLDFINCTFADNEVASGSEGGAISTESTSGAVNLANCILWGNEANGSPSQIDDPANEVSVTYSCVEGTLDPGWDDGFNINDDPLFFDPVNGNYRLAAGSPCIDKGNNADVPCDEFDVDEDGFDCLSDPIQDTPDLDLGVRIVDGDEILGADVDMGAYESVPCPWDVDGDGSVGASDLIILLFLWGTDPGGPPDFDGDGNVGSSDLVALLFNWGLCPCVEGTPPLPLAEEMAAHCLTMDDWDDFEDKMQNGTQAEMDNYLCWMIHYLDECSKCFCTGQANCPGPDPYNG